MALMLILAAVIVAILAMCVYCYHVSFYSPNRTPMDPYGPHHGRQYLAVLKELHAATRTMENATSETVTISSHDGLTLTGHYYHQQAGAPLMLLFHGYRSMYLRDCAGGYALGKKFAMNILAVDQRAHEKSGGHTISFGVLERRDCFRWVQYANKRFGAQTPIVLCGLSMGAATVLMATDQALPKNVVAVMADCPYESPKAIIKKVCRDRDFAPNLSYPFIRLAGLLFGHFDLEESSAIQAASHTDIPILLLHGEDDHFVPCDMSRNIHKVAPGNTQLVTFPGAGHGLSYALHPERYEQVCRDFLRQISALATHFKNSEITQIDCSFSSDI